MHLCTKCKRVDGDNIHIPLHSISAETSMLVLVHVQFTCVVFYLTCAYVKDVGTDLEDLAPKMAVPIHVEVQL